MKTAISLPDGDFERFERLAALHGMNRSQFYREAGARFADQLEDGSELTRIADRVLARANVTEAERDGLFLRESERIQTEGNVW